VQRFARDELLRLLPFEFDAMLTVLGHGFHPLKARQSRSIPNLQSVHSQGRTPLLLFLFAESILTREGPITIGSLQKYRLIRLRQLSRISGVDVN
jgi:hypothetical protein